MRSLPYLIEARLLGVFALLAAATVGCNSAPQDPVGTVRIALTAVPADVSCIRVRAMGARDVSQAFDVTPGSSSTLSMGGVSTGSVVLSAEAFAAPCATAGDSTTANWVSAPTTVQVTADAIADVTLVMHRNGRVNVGIDFQDDCSPDGGTPDGGKCLPPPSCHDKMRNANETDTDCGGGTCPVCDDRLRCLVNSDCRSGACVSGRCEATSCSDGAKNGTETDQDCGGGTCGGCRDGGNCVANSDCLSLLCDRGRCVPTCMDGIQNGTETDLDCGGLCFPCADGLHCNNALECLSISCVAGVCSTSCADGVKNGTETDQDCGGGTCASCANSRRCFADSDCSSLFCDRGRCAPTCMNGLQDGTETGVDCGGQCGPCPEPSCSDGAKNGTETDLDCGGGTCGGCRDMGRCVVNGDCLSLLCNRGQCVPSCGDGIQNGTETDLDCGGLCFPCADGLHCNDSIECLSISCVAGVCSTSCTDGVRNGTETDQDCGGGICATCANSRRCLADSDCSSLFCKQGRCGSTCLNGLQDGTETGVDCGGQCGPCPEPSCTDGAKNGTETDLDCGGGTCGGCRDMGRCVANSDCLSLKCDRGQCVPSCGDGIQNGTETDLDCGGLCGPCADGLHCQAGTDCGSGICAASVCSAAQTCALPNGLVSWWHGDDNFTDAAGSNHGSPTGTVTFAPGILHDGFSFDGTFQSYVGVADAADLDLTSGLTIDAWINPNEPTARIVDKISAFGFDGYLLDLVGSRLRIITGGDAIATYATVPLGVFTHVAGVFDGTRLALYINGVLAAEGQTNRPIPVNDLLLRIGADSGGGSMFNGVIDEPRVWSRGLSANEIQLLFQQPSTCP